MSCKTAWTNQVQHSILPSGWLDGAGKNGYRTSRKALLLEKEKSRGKVHAEYAELTVLPERRRKRAAHLRSAVYSRSSAQLHTIKAEIAEINALMAMTGVPAVLKALSEKKRECVAEKFKGGEKHELELRKIKKDEGVHLSKTLSIICGCPASKCQGMVKFPGICVTCEASVCIKCCELGGEGHVCDPGVLQSMKKIREMTKACPGPDCGERIEKVDGCDQMWCTKCKTAFSWTTRKVIHGTLGLHNPHYQEWRRINGTAAREIRDVPCGGFDGTINVSGTGREIEKYLLDKTPERYLVKYVVKDGVIERHDSACIHIMTLIRRTDDILTNTEYNLTGKLLEVGVRHTLGEIDEKAWCNSIFRATREAEKRGAIRQVVLAMRNVSIEYYNETFDTLRGRRWDEPQRKGTAHVEVAKKSLSKLLGIIDLFDGFLADETRPYKMKDPPRVIGDSKGHLSWAGTFTNPH